MVTNQIKSICRLLRKTPYGYKKPELFINLTYKCPLRCKYCYVNYKRDDAFDMDNLCYLFENGIIDSQYIKLVTFFGGEPALKIDLIENLLDRYYDICTQQNIHIAIITSMSVNQQKLLNLQAKYPMFEIVISFDNFSEDRIFADGKPFKVMDILSPNDLINHKRNICFHMVINSENSIKDLEYAQKLFKDYGLLYSWCWNKVPNTHFDISSYYNCMKYIIEENKYYPTQFIKELDNYLHKNNLGCGIGSELFLSANGDVSPCSISHYNNQFLLLEKGNVTDNVAEIIEQYEHNNMNNTKCINCDIKGFCNGGCIIERLNRGDFNTPNEHLCILMNNLYNVYDRLNNEYDLSLLNSKIEENYIGNLDYCYNTGINIDMYKYFNLGE